MPQRTQAENGRIGGHKRAASLTPARRKEIARTAHLASAVKAVVDRAPELTPEQVAKLRAAFASMTEEAGDQ